MPQLRLVIDTNVIVSGAIKRHSLQRAIFTLALSKSARFYVSRSILEEYADVLSRPEINIRPAAQLRLMSLMTSRGITVVPSRRISISNDPSDNKFLECADAAKADYLITGNLKHFPGVWNKTKVVSCRKFLELVAPRLLS